MIKITCIVITLISLSYVQADSSNTREAVLINSSFPAKFHHPTEVLEENGVAIIDLDNFDEFLNHHDHVVVAFYADWCGKSKEFLPFFEQAAEHFRIEMPPVPFAKLEATKNPGILARFSIHDLPQLYYIQNGKPTQFHLHNIGKQKIIDFVRKTRTPNSEEVKDESSLELLKSHHRLLVGYFGEENEAYHQYQQTTQRFEHVLFVHSFDPEFRESIGASLVIFKTYEDEERSDYTGDYSARSIKDFILANRYPTLQPFDDDEAFVRIFSEKNPAIFLFADGLLSEFPEFSQAAYESANQGVVFSHAAVSNGLGHKLAVYLGVKITEVPAVWAVRPVGDNFQVHKFRMEGNITKDNIKKFVEEFRQGRLERFLKTDYVDTNPEEGEGKKFVNEVVTSTFQTDVINTFKHVVVVFYYHWCIDTKKFDVIYQTVAEMMQNNPKVAFKKLDLTKNDHPDVDRFTDHKDFPVIMFYNTKNKEAPVPFDGLREEKAFLDFLKQQLGFDYIQPVILEKKRRRQIQLANGFK